MPPQHQLGHVRHLGGSPERPPVVLRTGEPDALARSEHHRDDAVARRQLRLTVRSRRHRSPRESQHHRQSDHIGSVGGSTASCCDCNRRMSWRTLRRSPAFTLTAVLLASHRDRRHDRGLQRHRRAAASRPLAVPRPGELARVVELIPGRPPALYLLGRVRGIPFAHAQLQRPSRMPISN